MSWKTRNPMNMAGAVLNSGFVNTGEVRMTNGGELVATVYSGMASGALSTANSTQFGAAVAAGADLLLFSGAGRLKDVQPNVQLSGVQITFYDAAGVASGGPFTASGVKVLAVIPANTWSPPGGIFGVGPIQYGFDVPFTSGLCVALKSGQPGFTVTFSPDTIPSNGLN